LNNDFIAACWRQAYLKFSINETANPMSMTTTSNFKGHFLMAMPALMDPNFKQSVTCISEHTDEGAVGIVINRVHPMLSAKLIFDELGMAHDDTTGEIPIHIGGPVHHNELFVLHGPPLDWQGSLVINNELAMSNSRQILEAIAGGKGPVDYLIALGCAGWGPGQLEWEIGQNAWLTCPCEPELIFRAPVEERWQVAIRRLGIDLDLLSDTAGHA
jgi:putative transcriptional regulator